MKIFPWIGYPRSICHTTNIHSIEKQSRIYNRSLKFLPMRRSISIDISFTELRSYLFTKAQRTTAQRITPSLTSKWILIIKFDGRLHYYFLICCCHYKYNASIISSIVGVERRNRKYGESFSFRNINNAILKVFLRLKWTRKEYSGTYIPTAICFRILVHVGCSTRLKIYNVIKILIYWLLRYFGYGILFLGGPKYILIWWRGTKLENYFSFFTLSYY